MDGKISEQRVYCKIQAQLGFPSTEIHADLQNVYGNDALKYGTVCKWVCRFNDGWESIENRVGRPVSVLTEKNVATVKTLIEEDAHYTVQEIEELSGIHSSSVLKILRERLGLSKICAHWVPHLLTDEQKQSLVRLASQVIEKYDKCDPRRLEEKVTGDETWIFYFQLILRLRLKIRFGFHLRATDLSLGAVAKYQIACCMRYFFIRKFQSFKFQSRKVVLSLESFTEKVFLLNLLISIRNADRESGVDVLDHPPYSPDPSPCDFWLFPRLKEMLAGHRFESRCGIGSAVYQCLQHIPKEDYRAVFRKWVDQSKMCVEADGSYFEGLR